MSLRRHASCSKSRSRPRSRSRSGRGRRKSPRSRRSASDRRERESPRTRKTRLGESSSESSRSASKSSASRKTSNRRRKTSGESVERKSTSKPIGSDASASDDDMKNMNSEEEEEWLEKRRLKRLQIQKKHETSKVLRSPSTTSAPSSGEKRLRTDSRRTDSGCLQPTSIAPGTPYLVCTDEGDETDIFGTFVASPAPDSPADAADDAPTSNAITKDLDDKLDADEVLKKLGASDSESDETPAKIPEETPQVVGGINVTELRKNLDKERAKLREFIRKTKNDSEEAEEQGESATAQLIAEFNPDLPEDCDDSEGYYKPRIGELIDGRFKVFAECAGKGVFSSVLKATEVSTATDVAIKIIRANDMMRQAAEKEVEILRALNAADPDNRRHVVRLFDVFTYRKHFCLVFELMGYNLRQALKNYGRGRGLTLSAVHAYAWQLFIALRLIKKCGIVHADIKPDNMLIGTADGKDLKKLKVCDLGSALDANTECDRTSYLVSRFYRAPEIILGQKYGYAVDVWAVGCTLYELLTGKILFKGSTNNDMLKQIIDVCGITTKMKRGEFLKKHFTAEGHLLWEDKDKYSKRSILRTLDDLRPKVGISKELAKRCRPEHKGKAKQLADLIRKALVLDPKKRITPEEAFEHPFMKEPVPDVRA